MAIDPVCGMEVDEKHALTSEYDGKIYYFCSPSCKAAFEENPQKYLSEGGESGHGVPF
jgi:YHS domain-containing protein